MMKIIVEPETLIRFRCPHCQRIWASSSTYDKDDENFNDLMKNGYTLCSCKCGKNFEAEVIKNEHEDK